MCTYLNTYIYNVYAICIKYNIFKNIFAGRGLKGLLILISGGRGWCWETLRLNRKETVTVYPSAIFKFLNKC